MTFQPLSDWEIDKIRLSFDVWLAKKCRRYHCSESQVIEALKEPQPRRTAAQMQVVSPERDDSMHPSGRTGSIDDGQPTHDQFLRKEGEAKAIRSSRTGADEPAPSLKSPASVKQVEPGLGIQSTETQVHSSQVPPETEAATREGAGADALGPDKTDDKYNSKYSHEPEPPPAIAEPATILPAGSAPPRARHPRAPKAPDDPTSLKNRVIALHKEHPEFTAQMAAEYLGANQSSVQSYASVLGFKWVTKTEHAARERERANFRGESALIDHYAEGRKRLGVPA